MGRISFSQLSVYQTCPRQYEFANVKKIPRQISAGESFGSSVHNTLSKWGKIEVRNQDINKSRNQDQLALFSEPDDTSHFALSISHLIDLWHQSFIIQGYDSKIDADQARKKGEVLMQLFFEWWQQEQREVLAIESGFTVETENGSLITNHQLPITISGRFDRVEKTNGGVRVIDYKTGALRSQEEVDNDLQLAIYAIAAEQVFGLQCRELVLLFLHEDGITEVRTTRTLEQLVEAREIIETLSEGINEGVFDPTPSESACRRCPYRSICDASVV